jgi:hypothetical protein
VSDALNGGGGAALSPSIGLRRTVTVRRRLVFWEPNLDSHRVSEPLGIWRVMATVSLLPMWPFAVPSQAKKVIRVPGEPW